MEKQLYQEMYNIEEKHWWFVGRRKILFEITKRKIGKVGQVLDIGCGTGVNAKWLGELGEEVYGVEMSDEVIELAKKRTPNLKVIKGEFPNIEISERFDLITLFDVLEHFEDDSDALKKIGALLNPGGYAVFSVPAFPFLWSEHDELAHHKRRYTARELREKLIQAGFSPVRITYFNTFLFLPIFLFRLMRKLLGLRGGKTDFFMAPEPSNFLLAKLFGAERFFLRFTDFPFVVSLLAVVKK
jgi:SAM-dependent methyltransferase